MDAVQFPPQIQNPIVMGNTSEDLEGDLITIPYSEGGNTFTGLRREAWRSESGGTPKDTRA